MTLPPVADSYFREPAVLITQAPGHRVQGNMVAGASTRTPVQLVTAPASAGQVRRVQPEGARIEDWRMFWLDPITKPLRVGPNQTDSDVIEYRDIRYRLRSVRDYSPDGIEVVGVRVKSQDD